VLFSKLNFGISNYFDDDYPFVWKPGELDYVTLANGDTGRYNRIVNDPGKFLNYFTAEFMALLYDINVDVFSVASYKLENNHDGKVCRHTLPDDELWGLVLLHGSDSISWNIHDVQGVTECSMEDAGSTMYYYVGKDKEDTESERLCASQVTITESYTNVPILVDHSIPQSFTNTSGTGYVTTILFTNHDKASLTDAFSTYM